MQQPVQLPVNEEGAILVWAEGGRVYLPAPGAWVEIYSIYPRRSGCIPLVLRWAVRDHSAWDNAPQVYVVRGVFFPEAIQPGAPGRGHPPADLDGPAPGPPPGRPSAWQPDPPPPPPRGQEITFLRGRPPEVVDRRQVFGHLVAVPGASGAVAGVAASHRPAVPVWTVRADAARPPVPGQETPVWRPPAGFVGQLARD